MNPTARLRFVERVINVCTSPDGTVSHGTTVRILQQWWDFETFAGEGEWRDVPLEKE